jgi:hypothetical protein
VAEVNTKKVAQKYSIKLHNSINGNEWYACQQKLFGTKQVLRSTILSSTIHFDLVRLISDLVRLSISRSKN